MGVLWSMIPGTSLSLIIMTHLEPEPAWNDQASVRALGGPRVTIRVYSPHHDSVGCLGPVVLGAGTAWRLDLHDGS